MKKILLIPFLLFSWSCNQSTSVNISLDTKHIKADDIHYFFARIIRQEDNEKALSDKKLPNHRMVSINENSKISHKKKNKACIDSVLYDRYVEFPGDEHFNGKPLIQQLEMTLEEHGNHKDTLSKIAVELYKSFDIFFPRAIADNWENGISTEMIMYPSKLIFHFQVFDNNYASKPYLVKEVIVKVDKNKYPYVE